jgi:hypothetical protein
MAFPSQISFQGKKTSNISNPLKKHNRCNCPSSNLHVEVYAPFNSRGLRPASAIQFTSHPPPEVNHNLPILAEHVHTYLIRHHDLHYDAGQHELAADLDPAAGQPAIPGVSDETITWITVRASALDKAYKSYNIHLAYVAAATLFEWVHYCFQKGHTEYNEFEATLRNAAQDAAHQLWDSLKQGAFAIPPPPYEQSTFEAIQQRGIEERRLQTARLLAEAPNLFPPTIPKRLCPQAPPFESSHYSSTMKVTSNNKAEVTAVDLIEVKETHLEAELVQQMDVCSVEVQRRFTERGPSQTQVRR